nr:hypothetical protein WCOTENJF_WCOTENJF_CDS_0013 [uncultured phage]
MYRQKNGIYQFGLPQGFQYPFKFGIILNIFCFFKKILYF